MSCYWYWFGNHYSCVGIFKNGRVEIIPNELGHRITPSVVAFTDEERLIGEAAKNQAGINPARTVYDAKRLIGRKNDDGEVQQDKKYLPFDLVNKYTKPYIKTEVRGESKIYAPEEISAMVLVKMKEIAGPTLGQKSRTLSSLSLPISTTLNVKPLRTLVLSPALAF